MENGYTSGYLASYDGFNRNLDTRGNSYSHNVYDRLGNDVYLPGAYEYQEPTSIVVMKNYSMSDMDRWHYFSYSDGSVTTTFVDPADGVSKSATDNLFVYAEDFGCAEILLQAAPVFIADALNEEALEEMSNHGIYTVWGEGSKIISNDDMISMTVMNDNGGDRYTFIKK